MFAAAIIVFREVLEAALIIGIIMAATRGVPMRGRWVCVGITGGVIGAGIIATLMGTIAGLFDGVGQEIINATILILAASLVGWHVVWMNKHGREIAQHMKSVGQSVMTGKNPMSILAWVIGLAVLREGAEIVLILQGLWTTGAMHSLIMGSALGFAGGLFIGTAMYLGFLALPLGRMFAATNALLIMIAAGMVARGANFLAQADILPTLTPQMWDTSHILSDQSIIGQTISAITGYIAAPNGLEVLCYTTTIILLATLMAFNTHGRKHGHKIAITASLAGAGIVLIAEQLFA